MKSPPARDGPHRFVLLGAASLLTAAFEIAIIREVTVATATVRTSAFLVFGFLHLFFGLGGWIADRHRDRLGLRQLLGLQGMLVLVSLGAALMMDAGDPLSVGLGLVPVGGVFTVAGAFYGVIDLAEHRPAAIGAIVATGTIGLLVGFVVQGPLSGAIGVNALCVVIAVTLLALACCPTWGAGLLGGASCVLAALFPVDEALEWARLQHQPVEIQQRAQHSVFSGWSPYAKVDIFWYEEGGTLGGSYDYHLHWGWEQQILPGERLPFSFIAPSARVLVIGASAGKEVDRFPGTRRTTPDNTTLVEIDPYVVSFLTDHPQYNGGIYERTRVVVADGRTVLERGTETWDVISIGTLKSPAQNAWRLATLRSHLLTTESLGRALDLLDEEGVLVLYQDHPALAGRIVAGLRALGTPYLVLSSPRFQGRDRARKKFIYAARSPARLEEVLEAVKRGGDDVRVHQLRGLRVEPLTDDRPIAAPHPDLAAKVQRSLVRGLSGLAAVTLGALVVAGGAGRRRQLSYFALVGFGFFGVQLHVVARFRSLFTHPLQTLVVVSGLFLGAAALGNLLSRRVELEALRDHLALALSLVAAVMAWIHVGTELLPFASPSTTLRLSASAVVLVPAGVLCGLLFPLGLRAARDHGLGLPLMMDGLGACIAFLLFYLVTWTWGTSWFVLPRTVGLVAAVGLLGSD